MTDKSQRDYAAEAKAALAQLRAYAADHAGDITGAIDKVADFVDKQTQGRYAERIDKAQDAAKRGVQKTLRPEPAHAATPTDPFDLDEEPVWKQPPSSGGAHAVGESSSKAPLPDLKAALAKLRAYASEHADDVSGLVDKVGDFVDKQTQGRYAERIDKAQSVAKDQIGKLK